MACCDEMKVLLEDILTILAAQQTQNQELLNNIVVTNQSDLIEVADTVSDKIIKRIELAKNQLWSGK